MAFRFVCLCALLAIARAGNIATPLAVAPIAKLVQPAVAAVQAVPVAKAAVAVADTEYDPHPQYNYAYDIQDAITGDSKGHQEIRDGDFVQGRYFLVDADGTRRIVEYTADPINGFNAVVHREPLVAAAPLVHAAPVVHAAPAVVAAKVATPITYTAPIAKVAAPVFAAPVGAPVTFQARVAAPIAPIAYAAPATITKTIIH